ncbi:hypothetical protein HU200_049305 [Digitaria exilis]|uniref:HMA domain-containing protein n=1 Tax=Digitaria exilis TaxID=1010633 RepID=A0A835AZ46_9POAL|nr:hypothetical protein HU200_049305 [Digitaria exilis]
MAPVILAMDVHCDSCAKKIRKAVMKMPGAESVSASFETGFVVVEGTADAAALRAHLQAKTKKNVIVVSDGTHAGEDSGAAGTDAATAGAPAAAPIVLEMELHCRRCHGQDGRGGAPGGGDRDGGRVGGGHEPRGQDAEAREGGQRPTERGRGRVRTRAAEGGGGAADAGDVRWAVVVVRCRPSGPGRILL